MANDADNVRVGLNGSVYIAQKGTTAPADLDTAWPAGWVDLGYLSDDGVEMSYSTESEDINAWQSLSPVRKVLTGVDMTLGFTAIELKTATVTLYFPSATMSDVSGTVHKLSIPAAPAPDERAIGLEWVDGDIKNRLIIARGEVTDREAITLARSGAVGLGMTVSAYADTAPEIAVWLSNDPAWGAAA
ncbi:phage tail protein [Streptomyces rochei]|uniref:phage tail tube protein n=1 Tax=Streptomyces TaxID=1883 RepID=UPI000F9D9C0B|nr:phage tail protein [Streptomyces sp. WAC08401]RSS11414.1 phage tail protein [Streptomyces sp. WAC08401]